MAIISFDVDEHTAALLGQLQKPFGVKTNAAVIRKTLALASHYADSDNMITIITGEETPPIKISVSE